MNKIAPNRIAIFSSDVMMKKKSIAVLNFTAWTPLLVRLVGSSMHPDELARDPSRAEHCDVQPGLRWLVRLLLRRWDVSEAILPFRELARRDRQFCSDSTRQIAELFRSFAGKRLRSNEASRRHRLLEEGPVRFPSHPGHCPAGESLDSSVVSGLCR